MISIDLFTVTTLDFRQLQALVVLDHARPHQSLNQNAPVPREVMSEGTVFSVPYLSGLHHLYKRAA